MDPEIAPFMAELLKYVNFNRIESAVSKFPDLKDRNKLREIVIEDLFKDAEKDEVKLPEGDKLKKIKDTVSKSVLK